MIELILLLIFAIVVVCSFFIYAWFFPYEEKKKEYVCAKCELRFDSIWKLIRHECIEGGM